MLFATARLRHAEYDQLAKAIKVLINDCDWRRRGSTIEEGELTEVKLWYKELRADVVKICAILRECPPRSQD